jgi:hypothetical protein
MGVETPVTDDLVLTCTRCGRADPMSSGLKGWGGIPREENAVDPLCPDCVGDAPDAVSLAGIRPVDSQAPGAPLSGAFRPVRVGDDLRHFVATIPFGQLWFECEKGVAFELQEDLPDRFSVTLQHEHWEPLIFRISRLPAGSVELTAPSRVGQDNDPLDVYQTYRLVRMGFVSRDDGQWTITLTPEETTPRNMARIVVHLGMFVYRLEPQWITEVGAG